MSEEKEIEYCCGINTVSGVFHKDNCDGSCGYPKDNEEYGKRILATDEELEDMYQEWKDTQKEIH